MVCEIKDLEEEVNKTNSYSMQILLQAKIAKLVDLRERIEEALEILPPLERRVIRLRFCEGLSIEETVNRIYFSPQWVWELQNRAFKKIEAGDGADD